MAEQEATCATMHVLQCFKISGVGGTGSGVATEEKPWTGALHRHRAGGHCRVTVGESNARISETWSCYVTSVPFLSTELRVCVHVCIGRFKGDNLQCALLPCRASILGSHL